MAGLFRMSTQLPRLAVGQLVRSPVRGNLLDSTTSITKCGCVAPQIVARRNAGSSTEQFHTPTMSEKRLLVWTKMYKSYDDIPESISQNKITKAKDLMRIRGCIAMMLATAFGCALMIHTGRKARDSGDTIKKRASDYIEEMAVKGRQEREIAGTTTKGE